MLNKISISKVDRPMSTLIRLLCANGSSTPVSFLRPIHKLI